MALNHSLTLDFVICCNPDTAEQAKESMEYLINRIGLQINRDKTQVVDLARQESFNFRIHSVQFFPCKKSALCALFS